MKTVEQKDIQKFRDENPGQSFKVVTRRKNGTKRVRIFNEDPSLTAQEYGPDTDINNIMAKYKKTGVINHLRTKEASYADMSEVSDLLGASIKMQEAKEKFAQLPSEVRKKFADNPQNMIDYLGDPNNLEDAEKLGLVNIHRPQLNDDELNNDENKVKNKNQQKSAKSEKKPDQE